MLATVKMIKEILGKIETKLPTHALALWQFTRNHQTS
jgi:hypothetical protein